MVHSPNNVGHSHSKSNTWLHVAVRMRSLEETEREETEREREREKKKVTKPKLLQHNTSGGTIVLNDDTTGTS